MLNTTFDVVEHLPFPHAIIDGFFPDDRFEALQATFPSVDMAQDNAYLGVKRSLSTFSNPDVYFRHVRSNPAWREFHDEVRRGAFLAALVNALKCHRIDLRCDEYIRGQGVIQDLMNAARQIKRGTIPKWISTRFEFSMMPANGGSILPHTDHPNKVLTLVIGFNSEPELQAIGGCEFNLCEPRDERDSYNLANRYLEFGAVRVVKRIRPEPNRAILFIKTHNSLHCVGPMSGTDDSFRKTITVNVEFAH